MAYTTLTLAHLRTSLAARYASSPFWVTAEADNALNETLRHWNITAATWRRRYVFPTVANHVYYSTPSALLHPIRMTWREYPVTRADVSAFELRHRNWEGETIASGGTVPTKVTIWIPVGLLSFALWPADTGINQMAIDGILDTPTLSLPTDFVQLGEEDFDAILDYALGLLSFKGPRDRWRLLASRGLRTFYQAAAKHRPLLRTIPALAPYFDPTPRHPLPDPLLQPLAAESPRPIAPVTLKVGE